MTTHTPNQKAPKRRENYNEKMVRMLEESAPGFVLYSDKFNEFVTITCVGSGTAFHFDIDFIETIQSLRNADQGFIYSDDWIFVGDL